jgi:hypothetical protein
MITRQDRIAFVSHPGSGLGHQTHVREGGLEPPRL